MLYIREKIPRLVFVYLLQSVAIASLLTHWGRGKMAANRPIIFWNAFSWMKYFHFEKKISLEFVPEGPIDNNPAFA